MAGLNSASVLRIPQHQIRSHSHVTAALPHWHRHRKIPTPSSYKHPAVPTARRSAAAAMVLCQSPHAFVLTDTHLSVHPAGLSHRAI